MARIANSPDRADEAERVVEVADLEREALRGAQVGERRTRRVPSRAASSAVCSSASIGRGLGREVAAWAANSSTALVVAEPGAAVLAQRLEQLVARRAAGLRPHR